MLLKSQEYLLLKYFNNGNHLIHVSQFLDINYDVTANWSLLLAVGPLLFFVIWLKLVADITHALIG